MVVPCTVRGDSSADGAARGKGGHSLSQKRMAPFKSPKRKALIGSLRLEGPLCLRNETACVAALLRSLPLDLRYDLTYFYLRCRSAYLALVPSTDQCGERSNAAAQGTSIPQAPHSFKPQTANGGGRGGLPSSFSGGSKGGGFSSKRESPLLLRIPLRGGPHQPGGHVISRPDSTWKCRCGTLWPACSPMLDTTR